MPRNLVALVSGPTLSPLGHRDLIQARVLEAKGEVMAKNQWFRLYNEALNNPKVQRLSGDHFKAWINILCVTSQCDGRDVTRDDLSFHLRMSHSEIDVIVDVLVDANLLVDNVDVMPYNWDERQYKSDSSAERTRVYREKKKQKSDGKRDVTVTPVVTPPETETDTEQKEKAKPKFIKPTVDQVREYMEERGNHDYGQADRYFDHNEAKGWVVGRSTTKVKDWKASVRTWLSNSDKFSNNQNNNQPLARIPGR